MKYIKYILAAVALISTASAATPDGKCGGTFGSCPEGTCCSKFGYCGKTTAHCGVGCQVKYGICSLNKKTTTTVKKTSKKVKTTTKKAAATTTLKPVTTSKKAVTTTKKAVTTTKKAVITTKKAVTTTKKAVTTLPISLNGMCGPEHGHCPGTSCCSEYGYCGVTAAHCGAGCQSEFGRCDNGSAVKTTTTIKKVTTTTKKAAATTTSTNQKISTNGLCGVKYGACPGSQCCSQYGYCGSSADHCGTGCQSEFGKCGNVSDETVTGFKYYSSCTKKNQWALTFDDGPYNYDIALLDLLKKKGVKATFFINGANVMDIKSKKAKEIIQRMNKDGHIIASHTWSHANISEISKSELIKEMTLLEDYIYQYTGKKPAFMRPPYGAGEGDVEIAKTLKSLGYTAACMWNVDTLDWDKTGNVQYALGEFTKALGKPILSLNHNFYGTISESSLLTLIEKEIDFMREHGYTPVTMDQCLGLDAYQKN